MTTLGSSCKNIENHEEIKTSKEIVQEPETDILSTTWMDDIQLNNDTKWVANIETTEGVEKMQALLKAQKTSSIEDYHQLASTLNDIKNNLVKACTMKGASHDNLHIWLYPLIKKISALSETNNLNEATKIKQRILENLEVYSNYFK
jgi:ABC-type Zn2+ transport system substrate-binding protein/surface adhesin